MSHRRPASSADDSIRSQYERVGFETYYRDHGAQYRNPHEPAIERAIEQAVTTWKPDLSHVLDLAAGSGEATLVLRRLGASEIHGIDPFTAEAYEQRTGAAAERLTFADIEAGGLAGHRYSLVVCSFALHLCEPSRLPALCYVLSRIARSLLILTPHKKPILRQDWGWQLIGERLTDRVRCRFYRSSES